jgi:hypothetical protein
LGDNISSLLCVADGDHADLPACPFAEMQSHARVQRHAVVPAWCCSQLASDIFLHRPRLQNPSLQIAAAHA